MTKQTAYESSYCLLPHSHIDKAIPRVAKIALIKVNITSEECWMPDLEQEGDYLIILQSFAPIS
jgi:hypothetical protein